MPCNKWNVAGKTVLNLRETLYFSVQYKAKTVSVQMYIFLCVSYELNFRLYQGFTIDIF